MARAELNRQEGTAELPSIFEVERHGANTRRWGEVKPEKLSSPLQEVIGHLSSWFDSRQWKHTKTYKMLPLGPEFPDLYPPFAVFIFQHPNPPTENVGLLGRTVRLRNPVGLLSIPEEELIEKTILHYGERGLTIFPRQLGPFMSSNAFSMEWKEPNNKTLGTIQKLAHPFLVDYIKFSPVLLIRNGKEEEGSNQVAFEVRIESVISIATSWLEKTQKKLDDVSKEILKLKTQKKEINDVLRQWRNSQAQSSSFLVRLKGVLNNLQSLPGLFETSPPQ